MGHVIPIIIIIIIKPKFANSVKSNIEEKQRKKKTHTHLQNITSSSFLWNKIGTKFLNLKEKPLAYYGSLFFIGEISPKRETQLL